jgi:hypothetical protein
MDQFVPEDVIGFRQPAAKGRTTRRLNISVTPPVPSPISPRDRVRLLEMRMRA